MTGIGGIGMSSIAEVLLKHGFQVSGTDLALTSVTRRLAKLGAVISKNHTAENVSDAEVVVYSSAVPSDNPELIEAQRLKIPVIRRAEMLAELMRMKFGIAVAGTHGKTTTTTMAGSVLIEGGLDPTIIVGGISPLFGSNARIGSGDFLLVEADEFDRSFLKLTPTIAVITSLELEHLDCYNDMDDLTAAFTLFANMTPFYGTVILCIDEPGVQSLIPFIDRPILTYGLNPQADIRTKSVKYENGVTKFTVYQQGKELGQAEIFVPGIHNVKNALAAIATALELDIPFDKIVTGLRAFSGVKRRFQKICEVNDIVVIDDYAHHHSEVKATLEAAKSAYDRRVIAVFQPHLYSRTRDFYREFGSAFHQADIMITAPIYAAREKPIAGISGEMITSAAGDAGHRNTHYIPRIEDIPDFVLKTVKPGDLVITMGAGNIWETGLQICDKLREHHGR